MGIEMEECELGLLQLYVRQFGVHVTILFVRKKNNMLPLYRLHLEEPCWLQFYTLLQRENAKETICLANKALKVVAFTKYSIF